MLRKMPGCSVYIDPTQVAAVWDAAAANSTPTVAVIYRSGYRTDYYGVKSTAAEWAVALCGSDALPSHPYR